MATNLFDTLAKLINSTPGQVPAGGVFGRGRLDVLEPVESCWLYAGSGFLLKAARRFDIGFEWFNRHFDIEKKPLQPIGLVAGAMVAVV